MVVTLGVIVTSFRLPAVAVNVSPGAVLSIKSPAFVVM